MTLRRSSNDGRSRGAAWPGAFVFALGLLLAPAARAQDAGLDALGRAGEEFFQQCDSLFGRCEGEICGQSFVWEDSTLTLTDLGESARIASTDDPEAQRMAAILNAYCGVSPGDPILGSAGILAAMEGQLAGQGRGAGLRGPRIDAAQTTGGGLAELGEGTQGLSIPLSYQAIRADGSQLLANGTLAIGRRDELLQFALAGSPGLSWTLGNETNRRRYAWGLFTPLNLAYSSVTDADPVFTFGAGLGGIVTATLTTGSNRVSVGASAAPRYTSAGLSVPLGALARYERPVFLGLDGFLSGAYGEDLAAAGTGSAAFGAGLKFGSWEFGYRAILGESYEAHTLGLIRDGLLEGSEHLERKSVPPPPPPGAQPYGAGGVASPAFAAWEERP